MIYGQNLNSEEDYVRELIRRYSEGTIDLTDDEANQLAAQAYKYGLKFDVESRPLRKGLFDLADTASFGLIPNKWRPKSPGQELYGETFADKVAGGVGTLGGVATGIGGAIKYLPKAVGYGAYKAKTSERLGKAIETVKANAAVERSRKAASSVYNRGNNWLDKWDPAGINKIDVF